MSPTSMHEAFDDVERDGNQKNCNQACGQHASEHGKAKQDTTMRARAGCQNQGKHAEDEGKGRHQDRPEPQSRSS